MTFSPTCTPLLSSEATSSQRPSWTTMPGGASAGGGQSDPCPHKSVTSKYICKDTSEILSGRICSALSKTCKDTREHSHAWSPVSTAAMTRATTTSCYTANADTTDQPPELKQAMLHPDGQACTPATHVIIACLLDKLPARGEAAQPGLNLCAHLSVPALQETKGCWQPDENYGFTKAKRKKVTLQCRGC